MPVPMPPAPTACRAARWSISAPTPCASWSTRGTAATRWRSSTRRRCCGLGRGLQATGRLNEEGMAQALTVLHRYHAVARAMGADPFEVLATAAVRDAQQRRRTSSPRCRRACPACRSASCPGERGGASFRPTACCAAFPTADGILADIGGGSLELVRLDDGRARRAADAAARRDPAGRAGRRRSGARARASPRRTWPRCRGWPRAPAATCIWSAAPGARWRASTSRRPAIRCSMVHHYTIGREEARDLAGVIAGAGRRALERLPGAAAPPHRRPALRRGGAAPAAARDRRAPGGVQRQRAARGLVHAAHARGDPRARTRCWPPAANCARALGRDPALPPALLAWTDPLFPAETRRGAAAARGGVLDVRHRQPRPSGIPRRAGVPAGAAPAGRSGSTTMRAPSSRWRSRMRYEADAERALPAPGAAAAGRAEHPPGGGARGGAAAGLHAVGRHARPAGRHRAAAVAAAGWSCGWRRTAACSPAKACCAGWTGWRDAGAGGGGRGGGKPSLAPPPPGCLRLTARAGRHGAGWRCRLNLDRNVLLASQSG